MKTIRLLLASLACVCAASAVFARADKSMVGLPLPALALTYLKDAPDLSGKPVVVEFWATWCGPCLKSIPHLNELHKKYGGQGLVIIGVTQEKKSVVTKFLEKTAMEYTPALDEGGALNDTFGISGIPHAVVADKTGKIVWEGHPMSLKESVIEEVLK